MSDFIHKLFTSYKARTDGNTRVGELYRIWYDSITNTLRIQLDDTPGGTIIGGGGAGGNYTLPTASTTVKGGVKIDGTTIAIASQVISVGTVPYSKLTDTPTIPTNTNQLTNGAGFITSSALSTYALSSSVPTNNNQLTNGAEYITSAALSGYATESYVTTRGYLTTVAYADVTGKPTLFSGSYADLTNKPTLFSGSYADLTNKPTIPTNNNELTNGAGYITSSALAGLATETYVTTRGYLTTVAYADVTNKPTLFSGSYIDLTNKPTIPTDINQLTDASGLLGQGGGGTTYVTNNVENPYSFSIAGDDSTLREIASGESIKITGAGGITVTTDAEGNLTVTGTPVSLAGYATESYVTSRGYITGLSYNDLTDKPNLAGTYTFNVAADDSTMREISSDETVKFIGAGGITTASDAEGNITITGPNLSSYATQTYVTTQGYITSSALTGLATESYVTSRGYITGLSYNDLTDKPNLAGTYQFSVAADDSTQRVISTDEVIKFVGASGITTASDAEGNITITGPSLAGLATETFVTTQGYITSSALTGLATETYVNQAVTNLVDGAPAMLDTLKELALSLNNDSNLAATLLTEINKKANIADLVLTIAGDDSTQRTISLGEGIKITGAGGVTTSSDAEGNITITGSGGGGAGVGQFTPNVVTVANTATAVINVTSVDQYNITALDRDVTFSVSSTVTPDDGQRLLIRIRDDGTARNLTWTQSANQFRFIGITPPTITSASKLSYIGCIYNAVDSRWDVISSLQQP